jgi:hypothetical protein
MESNRNARHSRLGCFNADVRSCRSASLDPARPDERLAGAPRSGDGSWHGAPRRRRQVPAALRAAALAAAGHSDTEHQDEQDRGDDEQDAPHGTSLSLALLLCAGETTSTPNDSPQQRPAGAELIDRQVDRQRYMLRHPRAPVLTICSQTVRNPSTSQHTSVVDLQVRRTTVDVSILQRTGWWGSTPGIPTTTEPH